MAWGKYVGSGVKNIVKTLATWCHSLLIHFVLRHQISRQNGNELNPVENMHISLGGWKLNEGWKDLFREWPHFKDCNFTISVQADLKRGQMNISVMYSGQYSSSQESEQ